MTNQIDHIVEHLFQKKGLDDVSVYELERFIATHPYFAAGHFLLAKKNQLANTDDFKEKVAMAALYYHNPLWLQWLLDEDYGETSKRKGLTESVPDRRNTAQIEETQDTMVSADEHHVEIVERPFDQEAEDHVSHFYSAQTQQETIPPTSVADPATSDHSEIVEAFSDHTATATAAETASPVEAGNNLSLQSDNDQPGITPTKEIVEDIETVHVQNSPQLHASEPIGDIDQPGALSANTTPSAEPEFQKQPDIANEAQEPGQKNAEEEEFRASAANIEKTLSSAALIPTKAEIEKNDFTFEPYHTIDYFASQGIKLQQSDLSKDKFGKQLRSFTEWLRSMKRLPNAAPDGNLDEATQQSIQNIAEHSFEEKEVVTETMAEVWIKQGNKEKAIDTLQKLSLLNPSKSHYFAAKIEQLKDS